MHYRRAVQKLHLLAEACQSMTELPGEQPFLRAVYVFGDVLTGADPVEQVQVACALDLPPDEVPWCSQPAGTAWLTDRLRLNKGGFNYWWRSAHEPVWNHLIREPVRFWSLDGTDDAVLDALRDRRFDDLPKLTASPAELRQRTAIELDRALAGLRFVRENYWEHDWRSEHRGGGRYPEDHLWEATDGYLDLLAAMESGDA